MGYFLDKTIEFVAFFLRKVFVRRRTRGFSGRRRLVFFGARAF